MKSNVVTKNSLETQKLGKDFILKTKTRVIALCGELGSGKTTFVQGVALGLEIKARIISPTFIIIRSYKINNNKASAKYLYHIDLYRIESSNNALTTELLEIINNKENIVVIEWPEKVKEILPKNTDYICFKYIDESKRSIDLK